jgi:SAM-dependent methyltransferase
MAWFENEDFWRDLYPYMFPVERLAAAPEQIAQILALTGVRSGHVLDLCCGPGRHSIEFARQGFFVTAVDRTSYLLDRARAHAAAEAPSIEFVRADMREFLRSATFDLAVNLFTSFGYFEDPDDELRVLRNVRQSLRPGGIFVMELLGKEYLAAHWVNARCLDFADGTVLVQRARVAHEWTRVFCDWTVIKDGRALTHHFDHTIYSGRELKDLLLRSGFSQVRLYGDLRGSPYGVDAQRLIAVASTHPQP